MANNRKRTRGRRFIYVPAPETVQTKFGPVVVKKSKRSTKKVVHFS